MKNIYNIYREEQEDDASESEQVDPKDDEEIDEEMVFNESDEEKFGSYFHTENGSENESLDDDDFGQEGDLSDLIKRENLQDLIDPLEQLDDPLNEFSDSDSDGSVKDLSYMVSKKRKTVDLNAKQGEFTIPSTGKVSISDLMESVQEETSFGALKKKLKGLDNSHRVDAPAATRIKNR